LWINAQVIHKVINNKKEEKGSRIHGKSKPYVRKVEAPLTAPEWASIVFDAGV
jgi:hypothetical protein